MQATAQAWLVLELTGSGTALGVVGALQYLPVLLFGGYGGVLVDRFDRHRLFVLTQFGGARKRRCCAALVLALTLRAWMSMALRVVLGTITSLEQPASTALVFDLVGPDDLERRQPQHVAAERRPHGRARVAGSAHCHGRRRVLRGPNAASFGFVVAASRDGHVRGRAPDAARDVGPPVPRGARQIHEDRRLMTLLVTSAVLFGLAWEFEIVVPLVARFELAGGAGTLGLLFSVHAVGAVAGGLAAAWSSGGGRGSLPSVVRVRGVVARAAVAPRSGSRWSPWRRAG